MRVSITYPNKSKFRIFFVYGLWTINEIEKCQINNFNSAFKKKRENPQYIAYRADVLGGASHVPTLLVYVTSQKNICAGEYLCIATYGLTECLSHNTNQEKVQVRNNNHPHCQVYWQPQLTASHPATWQVAHALLSALQLQILTQILQCWIQLLRLLHQPKKKFQSNITSLMCSPYNWGGHWRLLLV